MATEVDLQKLVVQLEASFTKYDRAWSKAMGVTDTNIRRVQQRFDGMSKSIANAGANTSRALDPIAGQTGNIAAQFQDIAVQLQGGQSPFLIAMQQGTQLSAVLSQAKSPIAALSSAFLQMVNPISLATIAAIALGGAAVQYLGSILGDGKSATDVIKEQNDVIRRVAENWGEAVPALKAYVDQLDRAADTADLNQAYDTIISKAFEGLKAQIPDLRAELAAARIDIEAVGGSAQEIDALQAAFSTLASKIEDGTATSADLDNVLGLLAGTAGSSTVPSLINLQSVLSAVATALGIASNAAARANAELAVLNNASAGRDIKQRYGTDKFVAEQERINGLTSEQLALETEIARVKSEADREGAVLSEAQALAIAQERLSAEERRAQIVSEGRSGAKDADREREAVVELIAELEHEFSLLGLTAQQKAVANSLRRAGAAATDAERQAITDLVNATYLEQQAIEATNEQMREFQDIAKSALQSFISDVIAGKDATEALGNALGNIGNRLLSAGLDGLFAGLGGGGGGGNIFSSLFGGGRATGGPVQAGRIYKVNENTPNSEYWMPSSDGVVMPKLPNAAGGASGGGGFAMGDIIIQGNADAMTVRELRQWSRFELPAIIRQHQQSSIPVNG